MLQLILESENERNLLFIQELAEKLSIHCRVILQKNILEHSKQYEIDEVHSFIKQFTQENTSFGDALSWQKLERQDRSLD